MIKLYFTVDNISTVIAIYDRIRIQKSTATSEPSVNDSSWASIPGGDLVAMLDTGYTTVLDSSDNIVLVNGQNNYGVIDTDGEPSHWYRSQYFDSTTSGVESAWSDPILGEEGDLYYNPLYPSEISYGTADQLIIDRIRTLIGDPIGLNREYGQDAYSSLHPDNRTYELDEKGWPASITMGNVQYNDGTNPYVNGYKYLVFAKGTDVSEPTISGGVTYSVDIWYYTFRHSDREIMDTYDNTPPPVGLTTTTATSEAYMLAAAIDLLRSEFILDATEDGATITDEGSRYDPGPGLKARKDLLDDLKKKLDDLVKTLILSGVEGVVID